MLKFTTYDLPQPAAPLAAPAPPDSTKPRTSFSSPAFPTPSDARPLAAFGHAMPIAPAASAQSTTMSSVVPMSLFPPQPESLLNHKRATDRNAPVQRISDGLGLPIAFSELVIPSAPIPQSASGPSRLGGRSTPLSPTTTSPHAAVASLAISARHSAAAASDPNWLFGSAITGGPAARGRSASAGPARRSASLGPLDAPPRPPALSSATRAGGASSALGWARDAPDAFPGGASLLRDRSPLSRGAPAPRRLADIAAAMPLASGTEAFARPGAAPAALDMGAIEAATAAAAAAGRASAMAATADRHTGGPPALASHSLLPRPSLAVDAARAPRLPGAAADPADGFAFRNLGRREPGDEGPTGEARAEGINALARGAGGAPLPWAAAPPRAGVPSLPVPFASLLSPTGAAPPPPLDGASGREAAALAELSALQATLQAFMQRMGDPNAVPGLDASAGVPLSGDASSLPPPTAASAAPGHLAATGHLASPTLASPFHTLASPFHGSLAAAAAAAAAQAAAAVEAAQAAANSRAGAAHGAPAQRMLQFGTLPSPAAPPKFDALAEQARALRSTGALQTSQFAAPRGGGYAFAPSDDVSGASLLVHSPATAQPQSYLRALSPMLPPQSPIASSADPSAGDVPGGVAVAYAAASAAHTTTSSAAAADPTVVPQVDIASNVTLPSATAAGSPASSPVHFSHMESPVSRVTAASVVPSSVPPYPSGASYPYPGPGAAVPSPGTGTVASILQSSAVPAPSQAAMLHAIPSMDPHPPPSPPPTILSPAQSVASGATAASRGFALRPLRVIGSARKGHPLLADPPQDRVVTHSGDSLAYDVHDDDVSLPHQLPQQHPQQHPVPQRHAAIHHQQLHAVQPGAPPHWQEAPQRPHRPRSQSPAGRYPPHSPSYVTTPFTNAVHHVVPSFAGASSLGTGTGVTHPSHWAATGPSAYAPQLAPHAAPPPVPTRAVAVPSSPTAHTYSSQMLAQAAAASRGAPQSTTTVHTTFSAPLTHRPAHVVHVPATMADPSRTHPLSHVSHQHMSHGSLVSHGPHPASPRVASPRPVAVDYQSLVSQYSASVAAAAHAAAAPTHIPVPVVTAGAVVSEPVVCDVACFEPTVRAPVVTAGAVGGRARSSRGRSLSPVGELTDQVASSAAVRTTRYARLGVAPTRTVDATGNEVEVWTLADYCKASAATPLVNGPVEYETHVTHCEYGGREVLREEVAQYRSGVCADAVDTTVRLGGCGPPVSGEACVVGAGAAVVKGWTATCGYAECRGCAVCDACDVPSAGVVGAAGYACATSAHPVIAAKPASTTAIGASRALECDVARVGFCVDDSILRLQRRTVTSPVVSTEHRVTYSAAADASCGAEVVYETHADRPTAHSATGGEAPCLATSTPLDCAVASNAASSPRVLASLTTPISQSPSVLVTAAAMPTPVETAASRAWSAAPSHVHLTFSNQLSSGPMVSPVVLPTSPAAPPLLPASPVTIGVAPTASVQVTSCPLDTGVVHVTPPCGGASTATTADCLPQQHCIVLPTSPVAASHQQPQPIHITAPPVVAAATAGSHSYISDGGHALAVRQASTFPHAYSGPAAGGYPDHLGASLRPSPARVASTFEPHSDDRDDLSPSRRSPRLCEIMSHHRSPRGSCDVGAGRRSRSASQRASSSRRGAPQDPDGSPSAITKQAARDPGWTPVHAAAQIGNVVALEEALRAAPRLLHARTALGTTALHVAAAEGHAGAVKTLLAHGADVNARDDDGATALHFAAANGRARTATLLIKDGAAQCGDRDGYTPLHYAAQGGHLAVVQVLVRTMSSVVDCVDVTGQTALHVAAREVR